MQYANTLRSRWHLAMMVTATLLCGCSKEAAPPVVSAAVVAIQDRAAIEDLLADYYAGFGASGEHDFSSYFTADGVLDVNGMVATGADQIRAMYQRAAGTPPPTRPAEAPPPGRSVMLLSNLSVRVDGDRATSNSLFTALHTDALTGKPWVNEYGREHNEYVKRDGRWQISRRTVTTDAGMPESLLKSYIQR